METRPRQRKKLTATEALAAEKAASQISVGMISVDIQASLQLAIEHDIYAYDAYFLQCARSYSLPLLTRDKGMKRAALEIGIQVLE